jgi:hypothetical protein
MTGLPLGFPEGLSNGSLKSGFWDYWILFSFQHPKKKKKRENDQMPFIF